MVENHQGQCTAPEKYLQVYVALHIYMYQLVLKFMLPAILIVGCNLSILYKVRQLRKSVTRHANNSRNGNNALYNKQNKTTLILLMISFTYVATLLPLVILSMVIHISMKVDQPTARFIMTNLYNLRYILELVSEINYGVNFYIYVMSGAQFRYELRHICSRRYAFVSNGQQERVVNFRKSFSRTKS